MKKVSFKLLINLSFRFSSLLSGTGSNLLLVKGLHLNILLKASHEPFKAPYFSIAIIPYSEQVGIYLQLGAAFNPEIYFL